MHGPPEKRPIGMMLWKTANDVGRAFDLALSSVGGSRPIWLILLALKANPVASQREIAAHVGIQGATLTHHLAAMEADGLLTRRRDPANRRVHLVELTEEGEEAFRRMRDAALDYDHELRAGIPDEEIDHARDVLDRLRKNSAAIINAERARSPHP